ncbi:MAG: hypothetical protein Q7J31_17175 [Syntrophales bacterium]|nr:hypothetical protein [Syntrophales bacterium]
MKKTSLTVAIFYLFAIPAVSGASYLIRLKNGGELATPMYWSEGDQIKFYIYGGVAGIQKDSVRKIRKLDQVYIEETVIQNAVKKSQLQPPIQKAGKTDNDLIDIEYYKREKQRLEQELDEAKQRYLSSLEKGDEETKHAASRDALKINIQIDQLKKELTEKNKGALPEWRNE